MNSFSTWDDYYDQLFADEDLGLFLDIKDTGITEKHFKQLHSAFNVSFAAMKDLESGEILNPDEHRQVGHYWLRNPDLAPTARIKAQINDTLNAINSFSKQILSGTISAPSGKRFTQALIIGIGGSALGPQFISDALGKRDGLMISFLDNTDPDGIDRVLGQLKGSLSQTLVIVISKSGNTAETKNGMLETRHYFTQNGLIFSKHAVAITGNKSDLHDLAYTESWLSIFPMWDWVGGRTSIMSAVGLLPATLAGVDIQSLLAGARTMDNLTRAHEIKDNPAALLALSWYVLGSGKGSKDMVIIPYKDRLLLFSRYLQQLIMESIGKRHDLDGTAVHQGLSVYGNKGSTDQHAYVQQLRDGLDNFFVTFIEVLHDREGDSILVDGHNSSGDYLFGFYKGTQTALSQSQRRSLTITISDISAKSIGALIALYERAVGLYATLIHVNAYHQPGVEAGKQAAGFVLQTKNRMVELLLKSDTSLSIPEICEQLDLSGQEPLIYSILRHYAANHELQLEGSFYTPAKIKVSLSKES